MDSKTNKSEYIDSVYLDIAALLEEYGVQTANEEEDEAFKEDLFMLFKDRMKGSFKNGIQVGLKRKARQTKQDDKQSG